MEKFRWPVEGAHAMTFPWMFYWWNKPFTTPMVLKRFEKKQQKQNSWHINIYKIKKKTAISRPWNQDHEIILKKNGSSTPPPPLIHNPFPGGLMGLRIRVRVAQELSQQLLTDRWDRWERFFVGGKKGSSNKRSKDFRKIYAPLKSAAKSVEITNVFWQEYTCQISQETLKQSPWWDKRDWNQPTTRDAVKDEHLLLLTWRIIPGLVSG